MKEELVAFLRHNSDVIA